MRKWIIAGLAALGACIASGARAAEADWKFFGNTALDGGVLCFYDAGNLAKAPDGHVKASTVCLLEHEFDTVDIQGKILDETSRKLAGGYVPPLGNAMRLTANQIITVTGFEQTADFGGLKPHAEIVYEIDCRKKHSRELSATFLNGGGSHATPGEWRAVQPAGNGVVLGRLVCAG
jgi:hypothetical protein